MLLQFRKWNPPAYFPSTKCRATGIKRGGGTKKEPAPSRSQQACAANCPEGELSSTAEAALPVSRMEVPLRRVGRGAAGQPGTGSVSWLPLRHDPAQWGESTPCAPSHTSQGGTKPGPPLPPPPYQCDPWFGSQGTVGTEVSRAGVAASACALPSGTLRRKCARVAGIGFPPSPPPPDSGEGFRHSRNWGRKSGNARASVSRLLMLPGEGSLQLYEGQLLQWDSNKNHREARRAGKLPAHPWGARPSGICSPPMPAGRERRLKPLGWSHPSRRSNGLECPLDPPPGMRKCK